MRLPPAKLPRAASTPAEPVIGVPQAGQSGDGSAHAPVRAGGVAGASASRTFPKRSNAQTVTAKPVPAVWSSIAFAVRAVAASAAALFTESPARSGSGTTSIVVVVATPRPVPSLTDIVETAASTSTSS